MPPPCQHLPPPCHHRATTVPPPCHHYDRTCLFVFVRRQRTKPTFRAWRPWRSPPKAIRGAQRIHAFLCDVNARSPLFGSQSQPVNIVGSPPVHPFFCDVNARNPPLLVSTPNLTPKIFKNSNPSPKMAPQTFKNSFPWPQNWFPEPQNGPPKASHKAF